MDTGLGLPDAAERWEPVLAELDAPVVRIVVTHFHPDHAGGGEDAQALTGARVYQGARDYEQCEGVWGRADWSERLADYLGAHGLPEPLADELRQESTTLRAVHPLRPRPGAAAGGRRGRRLAGARAARSTPTGTSASCATACSSPATTCCRRSRRRSASTPTRGPTRWATTSPRSSAPSSSRPAWRFPVTTTSSPTPPGARVRSSSTTGGRLDETVAALGPSPRSAYEVSLSLFGADLDASGRRFALAETLAHLERLVQEGRAARGGDDSAFSYTAT